MLPVALFAMSGTAAAQETVSVAVGDIWFCDASFQDGVCDTVIDVGDSVAWDFNGAQIPHTTTECGASCDDTSSSPVWDSGIISDGGTFQLTFTEPGTYLYRCEIHPSTQRGRIIVQGGAPTATVTPPPSPTASEETPTPATATPTTATPAPATPAPATPGNGASPTPTPAATTTVGSPVTGAGPQEGSSGAWWAPVALAATGGVLVALGGGWHARRRRLQMGSRDDG